MTIARLASSISMLLLKWKAVMVDRRDVVLIAPDDVSVVSSTGYIHINIRLMMTYYYSHL